MDNNMEANQILYWHVSQTNTNGDALMLDSDTIAACYDHVLIVSSLEVISRCCAGIPCDHGGRQPTPSL